MNGAIEDEIQGTTGHVSLEVLKAQVKAAGGTKAFYEKSCIIKELTRGTFQAMLDAATGKAERRFDLGEGESIPL